MTKSEVKDAVLDVTQTQHESITALENVSEEILEGIQELRETTKSLEARSSHQSGEMRAISERLDQLTQNQDRWFDRITKQLSQISSPHPP